MEKEFNLIQVLNNLNNIHRTGPTLFAGIPAESTDSIAEHSYRVACFCMIFGNKIEDVNVGNLVMNAVAHDWSDSVIGDLPKSSRSYQSYFEEDVRSIFQKAEARVLDIFLEDANITLPKLNVIEAVVLKFCDDLSVAIEVIDIKQKGYKHNWLDRMFKVQLQLLTQSNLHFAHEVVDQLVAINERGGMDNVYLTKATRD